MIQLVVHDKDLHVPFTGIADDLMRQHYAEPSGEDLPADRDPILLFEHPGGDHDTVKWPRPNRKHLAGALYDAREQGLIPDNPVVLLPDGKEFNIDQEIR